jgi:hypothetical protein
MTRVLAEGKGSELLHHLLIDYLIKGAVVLVALVPPRSSIALTPPR